MRPFKNGIENACRRSINRGKSLSAERVQGSRGVENRDSGKKNKGVAGTGGNGE